MPNRRIAERKKLWQLSEGMEIALTPHQEDLLKDCVKSGRYLSESEVLGEALRLWERQIGYEKWLRAEARKGYKEVLAGDTVRVESEEEFLNLVRTSRDDSRAD
ncbi:MAG: type II toxin-antitoxin system ParD family antitoxin [Verrucomicrobiota bacterium]